jgi:hypothetical protein
MKVALFLTGSIRTLEKTIPYLVKNIIQQNYQVDVFACIQNDKPDKDSVWEHFLARHLGTSLKNVQWFNDETYQYWNHHRNKLLKNMFVSENIKFYLSNSGSMIEYYQLQLAYMEMMRTEFESRVSYNYIIRTRTDTIFAQPISFQWLYWTEEQVAARINALAARGHLAFEVFMTTLLYEDITNAPDEFIGVSVSRRDTMMAAELKEYLKTGEYILTFRKNLLYIVRRNLFHFIPSIGTMYGMYMSPGIEPEYRWNAESQFRAACLLSNLCIYDYSTAREESSLYQYEPGNYFDNDMELLDSKMLYCLVRF